MKVRSARPLLALLLILVMGLAVILKLGVQRADAQTAAGNVVISTWQAVPATVYVVDHQGLDSQQAISTQTLTPTSIVIEQVNTPLVVAPQLVLTTAGSLNVFVHAPEGVVPQAYVILSAFESVPGPQIQIHGFVNLSEFSCTSSPCILFLTESSSIQFSASSSSGKSSPEVVAQVRVEPREGGFIANVDSVSQLALYRDACSNIWGVKDETQLNWSKFPEDPFQLGTEKTLHLLAAKLISSGIVNASDCPNGGLVAGSTFPNGCGVERARPAMVEWQNRYDIRIWSAALEVGIPPRLLKSLIEYESQYWPSNQRNFLDEYGLGQINQLGLDVLLRQNPDFYNRVCPSVYSDCSQPYLSLDPASQALVRGAILNSIDATCPGCEYGLDMQKASESIPLIAQLLRANCGMVEYLNVAGKEDVAYADLWQFTLAAYHGGYSCVRDAVVEARKNDEPLDWKTVSKNIDCKGVKDYVDNLWGNLLAFDLYRTQADLSNPLMVGPTFVPTPTPIFVPLPTQVLSKAQVIVRVYLDANANGVAEGMELLDGIAVQLQLENGQTLNAATRDGQALFEMNAFPPGLNVKASLPGLYREKLFTLPADGVVQVDFVFTSPEVPKVLP